MERWLGHWKRLAKGCCLQIFTLADVVNRELVDTVTGRVKDPVTGKDYTLQEAVDRGLVDGTKKGVIDPNTGQVLSLKEALQKGVVDADTGQIVDPNTGEMVSLVAGRQLGLVHAPEGAVGASVPSGVSLIDALNLKYLHPKTGIMTNPATGNKCTLAEGILLKLLDADMSQIVDSKSKQPISLKAAIKKGIVDQKRGRVKDSETKKWLSMGDAVRKGLIVAPVSKPELLQEARAHSSEKLRTDDQGAIAEGGLLDQRTVASTHTQQKPTHLEGQQTEVPRIVIDKATEEPPAGAVTKVTRRWPGADTSNNSAYTNPLYLNSFVYDKTHGSSIHLWCSRLRAQKSGPCACEFMRWD